MDCGQRAMWKYFCLKHHTIDDAQVVHCLLCSRPLLKRVSTPRHMGRHHVDTFVQKAGEDDYISICEIARRHAQARDALNAEQVRGASTSITPGDKSLRYRAVAAGTKAERLISRLSSGLSVSIHRQPYGWHSARIDAILDEHPDVGTRRTATLLETRYGVVCARPTHTIAVS